MFTTWKLTLASIKMFARNKQAIFFTFFTPLLIMLIFGAIGFDRAPKIDIGIVVQGSVTPQQQQLINQLRNIELFDVHLGVEKVERQALENDERAIVMLPSQYDSEAGTQMIPVLRNSADQQAPAALSIINQVLDKAALQSAQVTPSVQLAVEEVNINNLTYIDFLLPGLVALSIMQLSVFSVAFVFVDYKQKGILKRVIATPVKPYQFVTANIITRLIVAVIQAAFFIALGVLIFDVQIIGSYWLIFLLVLIGATMFLGLGFAISGLAKTTDAVPALANLIVFPMLFLGGTFFAIENMPSWLQVIARLLPLTYFSTAMREVMNKGAGFSDIVLNIVLMLVWAIILVTFAIYTFRFEEKRGN
jgi:ABC-2 type transport system permease protein